MKECINMTIDEDLKCGIIYLDLITYLIYINRDLLGVIMKSQALLKIASLANLNIHHYEYACRYARLINTLGYNSYPLKGVL
jgi:hypothetical protein